MQNTQAEAFEQMDYALSAGVNFWDTAEMYAIPPTAATYGSTEKIIGNWLAKNKKRRKEIILATKISPAPWARGAHNAVINRKNIIAAVEGSLQRLQTDYIDLYQLHWPTNRPNYHFANWRDFEPAVGLGERQKIIDNMLESLSTCDELMKSGKIKHLGLSDDSAWGVTQFCALAKEHNVPRIVSIQNEYNLLRRRDEADVMEACALEEVSYLSWSPLQMGILSGKYLNGQVLQGAHFSPQVIAGQEAGCMT